MKVFIRIGLAALVTLLYLGSPMRSQEASLGVPIHTRGGVTALIDLGLEGSPGVYTRDFSDDTATYTNGTHRIRITEIPIGTVSVIRAQIKKVSGEPFGLNNIGLTVRVPRENTSGIWYPSAKITSNNVMAADSGQSIRDITDANYGIPYIAAVSVTGQNVFAMGFGHQHLSVGIEGDAINTGYYELRLKAHTPRTATSFEEYFYISDDPGKNWFDTAADYANWVDTLNGYEQFPISDRAYKPVYDAWYWSGDRVDDSLYLRTAELASEAGAGIYLADAGWDAPAGEYDKWLEGGTGNYKPPPDKFPDLAGTFDEMRAYYGLDVELWLQPFAVGRTSDRYPRTRGLHIQLPQSFPIPAWTGLAYAPFALPLGSNLETVNLCPRLRGTHTYLRNLFMEVAAKYRPDGYWLDFIDGIAGYCNAPHNHNVELFGDGLRQSLEIVKSTILKTTPDAVVHFRAPYANLNTKAYANVWQSQDSPGDFDSMRLNALRLRPFSQGVVFASDQLYWKDGTDPATVAKFLMTSIMVGVPALGANLTHMPPETALILKRWLSFYQDYKDDLSKGRFAPFGRLPIPNHKIEGQDRTFAYIRNLNFTELPADGSTIFLLNATRADYITAALRGPESVPSYAVRVFNRYLGSEFGVMIANVDQNGIVNLDIGVEQGGMIMLTPLEQESDLDMDDLIEQQDSRPFQTRKPVKDPPVEAMVP